MLKVVRKLFERNAQLNWAFLFGLILIGAVLQSHGNVLASFANMALILLCYVCLSTGETVTERSWWFVIFVTLFLYSVTTSAFTLRSAFFSLTYLFSFLAFCTISDLMRVGAGKPTSIDQHKNVISVSKRVILLLAVIHASYLIYQYLLNPVRSTGLLLDYSQASLLILIGFGLNYLWIKNRGFWGTLISALLFLGFFTTFSRTSNFLLAVFMLFLFLVEIRKKDAKFICFTLVIVALSYLLIILIPEFSNSKVVDRGGLGDFATLNSRVFYWTSAIEAIRDKPLLGHGLGNYQFLGIKGILPYDIINSTHNDYLQIWVDLGFIWFAFFVACVAYTVICNAPIRRVIDKTSKLDETILAWALFSCLALYMLINFAVHSIIFQILTCVILIDLFQNGKNKDS